MSEETARPLFQQLMMAIEYCHSLGIANRDVKVAACRRLERPHIVSSCCIVCPMCAWKRCFVSHDMRSVRAHVTDTCSFLHALHHPRSHSLLTLSLICGT